MQAPINSPEKFVQTSKLVISYEEHGPLGGHPLILLHGWPDSPRTWDAVLPDLCNAGFHCYVPTLRGFGQTRFLSDAIPRSGQATALATDLIDFADAVGLTTFCAAGHDWGAFACYLAAARWPARIEKLVAISVPYGINTPSQTPSLPQTRAFWYQWLFQTPQGKQMLEEDRGAFCRFIWETWMPGQPVPQEAFEAAAPAWENPDWISVTLHYYRNRWGAAIDDPDYAQFETFRLSPPCIAAPTLLIHGESDPCILASTTENKDHFFSGNYIRQLLSGVGHFPQREKPALVGSLITNYLKP